MKHKASKRIAATILTILLSLAPAIAYADMNGIDVSGWQTADVTCTAEYDFAVVKATQGTGFVNKYWKRQAECVVARWKALGLYHYASGGDPIREADHYLNTITHYVGNAVLVLDWEEYQNPQWGNTQWVDQWIDHVHDKTGVWPIIYIQTSALGQLSKHARENCGLWVARYPTNATVTYHKPSYYGRYGEAMGQYTSAGRVNGYTDDLDLNYFRGDRWQWDKYANPTGTVTKPDIKPATPTTPQIAVDGSIGIETVTRWQQIMGTPVDGVITGQVRPDGRTYSRPALHAYQYGGEGSTLIRAVQRKLKAAGVYTGSIDGLLGPKTIDGLHRYLGVNTQHMYPWTTFGPGLATALQTRLNTGTF